MNQKYEKAYGMRDLLLHLMHINKREEIEPMKDYTVDKVILLALAACYRYGYDITYDYLIEKSVLGAKVENLTPKEWTEYTYIGRKMAVDKGKSILILEENKELDDDLKNLILNNSKDSFFLPRYIKHTPAYQKDIDTIKEIGDGRDLFATYPYWTKEEIVNLLGKNEKFKEKVDSKIPLKKDQFEVMRKYLRLVANGFDAKESFSLKEIRTYYDMPKHLIKSIEENGMTVKSE